MMSWFFGPTAAERVQAEISEINEMKRKVERNIRDYTRDAAAAKAAGDNEIYYDRKVAARPHYARAVRLEKQIAQQHAERDRLDAVIVQMDKAQSAEARTRSFIRSTQLLENANARTPGAQVIQVAAAATRAMGEIQEKTEIIDNAMAEQGDQDEEGNDAAEAEEARIASFIEAAELMRAPTVSPLSSSAAAAAAAPEEPTAEMYGLPSLRPLPSRRGRK